MGNKIELRIHPGELIALQVKTSVHNLRVSNLSEELVTILTDLNRLDTNLKTKKLTRKAVTEMVKQKDELTKKISTFAGNLDTTCQDDADLLNRLGLG